MESDLYLELQEKTRQLDISVRSLRTTGTERANAERDYKILLRSECLRLRDEGMPVSLIALVVYGIKEVADARRERDIADAVYEANKESINALKWMMKIINEQIGREWSSGGK